MINQGLGMGTTVGRGGQAHVQATLSLLLALLLLLLDCRGLVPAVSMSLPKQGALHPSGVLLSSTVHVYQRNSLLLLINLD